MYPFTYISIFSFLALVADSAPLSCGDPSMLQTRRPSLRTAICALGLLSRNLTWGFDISGASKRHAGRMTASSLIMSSTTSSKETVAIIGGGKSDLRISNWHVLSDSKTIDRDE